MIKEYRVSRVQDKDNINWETVPKANIDIYKWTDNYKADAYAQVVMVPSFGIIAKLTCMEVDPLATRKEDCGDVYKDSCLEFFSSFDGGKSYFNMEANANAARTVNFRVVGEEKQVIWASHPEMFQISSYRAKDHWYLIYVLKFDEIKKFFPDYALGNFTANFYHMGTNPYGEGCYYSMWNEIDSDKPNFHRPDCFGKMVL